MFQKSGNFFSALLWRMTNQLVEGPKGEEQFDGEAGEASAPAFDGEALERENDGKAMEDEELGPLNMKLRVE